MEMPRPHTCFSSVVTMLGQLKQSELYKTQQSSLLLYLPGCKSCGGFSPATAMVEKK